MWSPQVRNLMQSGVELAPLTTVRVGGHASWFATPQSLSDVRAMLREFTSLQIKWRTLGGGSNLLVPDSGVDGVVISPAALSHFEVHGNELIVGAGLPTAQLVAKASAAGLAGVHVLAGVPGQVGGALVMNAGTRYGELGAVVARVGVVLPGGDYVQLTPDDLKFGYRSSSLPDGAVVTDAVLRLTPVPHVQRLRRAVGRMLKEKNASQPTRSWNFGCMFKNPPLLKAGALLDAAGLKGLQRGGARISPVHANFIENLDAATSEDIRSLIEQGEAAVLDQTGVQLQREVRVW